MSVNLVILVGNIGRDPEVIYSKDGTAICNFSLATSRKKKEGGYDTAWHRCVAFGQKAELISKYCKKGSKLYINGELEYRTSEKDGLKIVYTNIRVNGIDFLSPKNEGEQYTPPPITGNFPDDDIPF
jgi:single-strand DNA-binding protein